MILKYQNLILTVFSIYYTQSQASEFYFIPSPVFRVFRPRGFEVSIPHTKGIQQFTFSGNLNKPIKDNYDVSDVRFRKSVFDSDPSGRMTVRYLVPRLKLGDKIYYQLNVLKDDMDYSSYNQMFVVRVCDIYIQPKYYPTKLSTTILPDYYQPPSTRKTTILIPDQNTPAPSRDLDNCCAKIHSLAGKVSGLVAEVERLSDENRLLHEIGNRMSNRTRLFLSGKISSTDDPTQVVLFVFNEKLGMKPNIVNVKRNDGNIIQFDVESLDVKLEILRKVEEKLSKSKSVSIFI